MCMCVCVCACMYVHTSSVLEKKWKFFSSHAIFRSHDFSVVILVNMSENCLYSVATSDMGVCCQLSRRLHVFLEDRWLLIFTKCVRESVLNFAMKCTFYILYIKHAMIKTIDGFCIMIIHQLIFHCFFGNVWPKTMPEQWSISHILQTLPDMTFFY